eukprot:TRINITY_DN3928_c0_g1_i3.p1 TRINITY_DN3928_c0_g1~~TRINITY_DN3928_c0_g1_i3.p1  ORF type:complete len:396 (-),score=113.26 TRINITY_DN3928_c0_g1_i3:584-1771(-)
MTEEKPRSNMMSAQEEEEMELMMRARRSGRSSAFYGTPARNSLTLPVSSSPKVDESCLSDPNRPITNDKILRESKRLRIGFASSIGRRSTMEDEITIVGQIGNFIEMDYLAVFDGHGGRDAATYASKHLHNILTDFISQDSNDLSEKLKNSFLELQSRIRNEKISGGSTAIVALIYKNECHVANAGDSRAVISEGKGVKRCSTDHKPEVPEEKERISNLGGCVTSVAIKGGKTIHRVNGILAVSRAFGDLILEPFVTAEPEVQSFSLGEETTFVLACDGLWDVLTDEEAIEIAKKESDPKKSAERLVEAGIERMSTDNISVIVASIPRYSPTLSNPSNLDNNTTKQTKERKGDEKPQQKMEASKQKTSWIQSPLVVPLAIGILGLVATWLFKNFS